MEGEVLVQVEGLSKKFAKTLKKSLKYGAYDLVANLRGRKPSTELRPEEFWALQDINFEVRRGECLGLIGHNGAGKSTLLKILNGLINPDQGKVTMKGRVGALIELGAGFNPIMSGRENIYNNGAVLGFSREEIDGKVEEIIDFAEIREFIDMPVQNYSSGMKVRLGFAVAAQTEPDVLIIDEVLAVGDAGFRTKCFNRLEDLIKKCAVIIVSHSMPQISRICSDLILLKNGKINVYQKNNLGAAIESYYQIAGKSNKVEIGNGKAKIKNIKINDSLSDEIDLKYNEQLSMEIEIKLVEDFKQLSIRITFFDVEQKPVAQISSVNDNQLINGNLNTILSLKTNNLFLNTGTYTIHIAVHNLLSNNKESEVLHLIRTAKTVNIIGNSYFSHAPCLISAQWDSPKLNKNVL
jgi:lipopolysaccharide transport system ATP-binding protein